jgi:hypothetical protein
VGLVDAGLPFGFVEETLLVVSIGVVLVVAVAFPLCELPSRPCEVELL